MLHLSKIETNTATISAFYMPEGGTVEGYLCLDRKTGKILEEVQSDAYGRIHAVKALRRLANLPEQSIPKEKQVLWY